MDEQTRQRLLLARTPKPKKEYKGLAKKSAKKIQQEKEERELRNGNETELQVWFNERRKEMTGKCSHCGGKSCKNSNQYFRHSVAHILPRRFFPSVETHPSNFVELCFWEKNCHGNFDNNILDIMDMNCFDEIIEKFKAIYPSIDKKERKYIPDVLLQYLNT